MSLTKLNIKLKVLQELEHIRFPKCNTRKNVSSESNESFVLGEVNYRGQHFCQGKTRGESRYNTRYETLYNLLRSLIRLYKPEFTYTTIQINKNVKCLPHIDMNNVGESYIIGLGDYTGGQLNIEGKLYNIRNRWKRFNGHKVHWTEPWEGNRYSLIYFTHTFKPPNRKLTNLVITRKGIYDKNSNFIEDIDTSIRGVAPR